MTERPNENWRRLREPTLQRRMVAAIAGPQGSGKTRFALTAPGPIAFMNFDEGYEGVTDKFIAEGKEIHLSNYLFNHLIRPNDLEGTARDCRVLWKRMVADYQNALKWARTVAVDTTDRQWELLRLARFGKREEIPPFMYRHLNPEYESLVDLAKQQGRCNVIFLVRVKKEYETTINAQGKEVSNPTGRLRWSGYSTLPYLVHMDANMSWDPEHKFQMTIGDKCRQNARLRNTTLELPSKRLTFPNVASLVFRGTTPEEWSR